MRLAVHRGEAAADEDAPVGLHDDAMHGAIGAGGEGGVGRTVLRVEQAAAVNSCTAAMHLSILAAGVGPGDEVITTGGLIGKVVKAEDKVLTLELAKGVQVRQVRASVQALVDTTKLENTEEKKG